MKIWVVLPAYNEELGLPPLIQSLEEHLAETGREFKILIVNDGSRDGTGKLLDSYAAQNRVIAVHNEKNRGLAETIKRGLLEGAKLANDDDLILTMDADNTHPAGLALRMVRLIREGNDVVIASRYREGSHVRGLAIHRRMLSWFASILFRLMFPIPGVRDYTCGYRAYRVLALKKLINRYNQDIITERGFSCMVDILLRLRNEDLVFTEVPLVLRYDQKQGNSKMQIMRTIMDTLKLMLRRRIGQV
ncbi:MAG: glycosyltransferase [Xanthomonadaceae bacterium]|nr:glycosyltransferase [Xanthomonadaceae bacterium]